ncbi:hypothetical protein TNCV_1624371 [Trichonephila clavipes]|nr:hypothetical protein TNCV_1624371 [Trichonephila clavipes]
MIFLRNHKNCSKKCPQAKMHASHRRQRKCRTSANTPDFTFYDSNPRNQDSSYGSRGRLGERADQFTAPLRPFHRPGYAVSNALHTYALKCAGAPSCWNHIRAFMLARTLCSRTLHPYIQY